MNTKTIVLLIVSSCHLMRSYCKVLHIYFYIVIIAWIISKWTE